LLAHPDDESLGTGGILAKYAAEGVETYLVTATRGERGWTGPADKNPGLQALGRIREKELMAAAAILKIRAVHFLDYVDGDFDQANPAEVHAKIVTHLRRIRPQVVVTFDPFGGYGHPDHIAICQFASAAVTLAADPHYLSDLPPHHVSKMYYMAFGHSLLDFYESIFGELVMHIDGVERRTFPWPDWAITTRIDTSDYWQIVRQAVRAHESQHAGLAALHSLPDEKHRELWGMQTFYRAFSLVNNGRQLETDLFAGLR
jgi:LmbE family N-acetylglucosaminyl deacetylase